MTCSEFKMEYAGKTILAFVTEEITHLFKFEARFISFFMLRFLDKHLPFWRHIYFYEVDNINVELTEDGKISRFEDKAKFLYLWAKHTDQTTGRCVIKRTFLPPDMSLLEGKRAKVATLRFDKD